jgi:hypothetical protein
MVFRKKPAVSDTTRTNKLSGSAIKAIAAKLRESLSVTPPLNIKTVGEKTNISITGLPKRQCFRPMTDLEVEEAAGTFGIPADATQNLLTCKTVTCGDATYSSSTPSIYALWAEAEPCTGLWTERSDQPYEIFIPCLDGNCPAEEDAAPLSADRICATWNANSARWEADFCGGESDVCEQLGQLPGYIASQQQVLSHGADGSCVWIPYETCCENPAGSCNNTILARVEGESTWAVQPQTAGPNVGHDPTNGNQRTPLICSPDIPANTTSGVLHLQAMEDSLGNCDTMVLRIRGHAGTPVGSLSLGALSTASVTLTAQPSNSWAPFGGPTQTYVPINVSAILAEVTAQPGYVPADGVCFAFEIESYSDCNDATFPSFGKYDIRNIGTGHPDYPGSCVTYT